MTKQHMDSRVARRRVLLGASVLAIMATPALAQEAEESVGVADIVVTAQKREQSLQDVPIAITAISQDTIKANRIVNVLDVAGQAPNLSMRQTAGSAGIPNFMMRGSVSYGNVAGTDKAISLYLDGVYLGTASGSTFDLPDLERIEVLRGPQGTLFGRNATAGAISIITRDPSGEFGLTQQLSYGNYNQLRSSTRVELPQVGPFSASISYTHNERDGDVRNLGAGKVWDRTGAINSPQKGLAVSPKRLGDQNTESVFAALKFEPSDSFKMVYKFDWMENNFTPEAAGTVSLTPERLGAAGNALAAAYAANGVPIISNAKKPKEIWNWFATPGYQTMKGHSLTSTLVLNDSLTLKNIAAWRKSLIYVNGSFDSLGPLVVTPAVAVALGQPANSPLVGSPYIGAANGSESHVKHWSDELQINYDSKFLTLTAGAIYYYVKTQNGAADNLRGTSYTISPLLNSVIPAGERNVNFNTGKSLAGYVQAEAHLTPELDVIGGFRMTRDKKSGIAYTFRVGAQRIFPFTYKDTRPSYLIGVNWKPTPDLLVYGKFSTGFVSGGSVAGQAFPSETVKAWEGGVKADVLNGRLRANLALFKADYNNVQSSASGANLSPPNTLLPLIIVPEGDLDTKGMELELSAVPVRGLTLNASTGYTDYKFSNLNPLTRPPGSRNTIRPKWTANLSGQYDTEPLFGDATMMFRVDAIWRASFFALGNPVPAAYQAVYAPILKVDPIWKVNARIAVRDIDFGPGKAELALWGRNLFNSVSLSQPLDFTFITMATWDANRTYGVDLTFDF
ncbi:MAG TPA: TonB-dependent receptor [Novosphingobium sp.]|nr:TonB-dependent receptor [Novosphingobium sp.]